MYRVKINDKVLMAPTRATVVALLSRSAVRGGQLDPLQPTDVEHPAVTDSAGAMPLIFKAGQFGLDLSGDPRVVLTSLAREVRDHVSRHDGSVRDPWEMSLLQWQSLMALFDLAKGRALGLDVSRSDQPREPTEPESLSGWFASEALEIFGFDDRGPLLAGQTDRSNDWHEHMCYALCALRDVPNIALEEFAATGSSSDRGVADALLAVPELRGQLAYPLTRALLTLLLGKGGPGIHRAAVTRSLGLLRTVEAETTTVAMDDILFAGGVLSLPAASPAVTIRPAAGGPLARLITRETRHARHALLLQLEAEQKADGRLTKRRELCGQAARAAELAQPVDAYGQALEALFLAKDVAALLPIIGTPDGQNMSTKAAFEEHLGIRLSRLTQAARRDVIFDLCGINGEDRRRLERQWQLDADQRLRREAIDDLRQRVQTLQFVHEGATWSGADLLDKLIVDQGATILSVPCGRITKHYLQVTPTLGFKLCASNGSLPYARALTALHKQPAELDPSLGSQLLEQAADANS